MVEIKVLGHEEIDKSAWDCFVMEHGENFLQLSLYAELNIRKGCKAKYIVLYEKNKLKGGMMFMVKPAFLPRIVGTSPIAEDNRREIIDQVLKEYMNHAKKTFSNYVTVTDLEVAGEMFRKNGFVSDQRATIYIDTTKDHDELWKNLNKKARWGVKKAMKSGLTTSQATSKKEWDTFMELYVETCKRDNIPVSDLEDIKYIMENMWPQKAKLILAKKDKKIIAGVVVSIFRNTMWLLYNASSSKYLYIQPNNLLYWAMIEKCQKNSLNRLDLGGYATIDKKGNTRGINRFKERWGGKIIRQNIYSTSKIYILAIKVLRKLGGI